MKKIFLYLFLGLIVFLLVGLVIYFSNNATHSKGNYKYSMEQKCTAKGKKLNKL